MRWLRVCRTVRSPCLPIRVMVQRSPFLTQSVAVRRSRRSLVRVMITSPTLAWLPSAKRTSGCGWGVVQAMGSGAAVEFGDQVAGGGEHDRVEPSRSVGSPSAERILGGGGEVADMDAALIKVEVERLGLPSRRASEAAASAGSVKRCSSVEAEGAVDVFDVAQDAAGADRGELLIITDQPDTRTTIDDELDGGVEGEGVGHAGFVDDHQGGPADRCRPVGQLAVAQGPGELGEGVGADAGLLAEDGGRGGRRGQAEHLAAVLGPGQGEGAHGGCLSGAGRGDRQLQPCPGGAHLADQCRLPSIQCSAVRRHLQQGQIDRRSVDGCTVASSGGGDEALFGVEDPLRGVEVGAGDGVDRRSVDPPQRLRFLDVVSRCEPGQRTGDRAPHRPAGPPRHSPVRPSRRSCGPVVVLRPGHATSARSSGFPP